MFCRKCGTANDDNAYRCMSCGQVLERTVAGLPPGQQIPNYLAHSIGHRTLKYKRWVPSTAMTVLMVYGIARNIPAWPCTLLAPG